MLTQTCQITGQTFQISDQEEKFYKERNLPLPKFLPSIRLQRRMLWRNDREFYHRKCDLTGKQFISIYDYDYPFPVYHPDEWYGDNWDPMDYGQDYDFSKPFFEQFHELRNKVPKLGIDIVNCENSYYCNYCGDDKNCYLDIAGESNEDCYYNLFTKYSKDCMDCTFVYNSNFAYESINCYNCHTIAFGIYLDNCSNCNFCFDLKGCKNCFLCSNLRQKEYCFLNQQLTKEEYEAKIANIDLGSFSQLSQIKKQWIDLIQKSIHRDMYNLNSENCTGNNIKNSKNCHQSYNITDCEDCMYLYDVLEAKDCYDLNYSLYHPEKSCELMSTLNMKYSAYCMASHYCNEALYCDQSNHSNNIFGCIGVKRKQYCILNKQYTKKEYEALLPKIIEHMTQTGEWGQFFPPSICPFRYNETIAQEYFPLTKEQAIQSGFKWKDATQNEAYQGPVFQIPDQINDSNDITSKILTCQTTGKPYKIIPQELKLNKIFNIALPRVSPDQRHLDRIRLRNPRHLYQRNCSKCQKQIQSSYSVDRKESVYCEECYLETVY